MIQFVIGAIVGVAAKKYLTKERVEKVKDFVNDLNTDIEKKASDTYDKNTAFDIEKNVPDMPTISFSTKTEAQRAMWFAMGSIDDRKYVSYYDLSTAFKPNKLEYVGSAKYGWTDKNSFLVHQRFGDTRWYITIDAVTKIPNYLLYSENMRKDQLQNNNE